MTDRAQNHHEIPRNRSRSRRALALSIGVLVLLVVALQAQPPAPIRVDRPGDDPQLRARAGGDLTVDTVHRGSFGLSAPNLPTEKLLHFTAGNRIFTTNWVTSPASVRSFDGLGPVFNRVSCSGCHLRDGRGEPPASPDELMSSMLVRLSVPGTDAHGGPKPHPVYGLQLQDRAILNVPAEGHCSVDYTAEERRLPDGTVVTLRVPHYSFRELNYGPLGDDVLYSPRVAPAVFGLGLLEAIPEADIIAAADPEDADKDGISGRPNRVWNPETERYELGRFGWKANAVDLRTQSADAALGDIGLTSSRNPQPNRPAGDAHREALDAAHQEDGPELSDKQLRRLTFYMQTLAVPASRDVESPIVIRGRLAFQAANCNACHTESQRSGPDTAVPELANQRFFPYTDLLLHDMGDGLADGRPDHQADGREWRTPPLWGIGLQETVSGHTTFLHDGRARNLTEAILWHDGEAAASRQTFERMSAADREALIAFLNSL